MARGVKIRVITERSEIKSTREEEALKKNPLFELKYISGSSPFALSIFDDKELDIRISNQMVPRLWTNNDIMVKLAEKYFENMWNNAEIA
jgi:hypothetical protein